MLCCAVLCCAVLCCAVLCCAVLYSTVMYRTVLYCTALHCTALHCTVLYCTVLYCTVRYCTVLYCAVLYWTALYCTVQYCTVQYCTVLYCTILNLGTQAQTLKASAPILYLRPLQQPFTTCSIQASRGKKRTVLTSPQRFPRNPTARHSHVLARHQDLLASWPSETRAKADQANGVRTGILHMKLLMQPLWIFQQRLKARRCTQDRTKPMRRWQFRPS